MIVAGLPLAYGGVFLFSRLRGCAAMSRLVAKAFWIETPSDVSAETCVGRQFSYETVGVTAVQVLPAFEVCQMSMAFVWASATPSSGPKKMT
jgi:hypothetical protein